MRRRNSLSQDAGIVSPAAAALLYARDIQYRAVKFMQASFLTWVRVTMFDRRNGREGGPAGCFSAYFPIPARPTCGFCNHFVFSQCS